MRDCSQPRVTLWCYRIWGRGGIQPQPQSGLKMNCSMRRAVGNTLQVMEPMKRQVVLNRTSIRDISSDISEFQYLLCSVELEEKRLIVVFVRASDQIEAGANKRSWKVP